MDCLVSCWVVRILYMFRIQVLYQIGDLQIFSQIVDSLFILLILCVKEVLTFDEILFIFFVWFVFLCPKKSLSTSRLWRFSSIFLSQFYTFSFYIKIYNVLWVNFFCIMWSKGWNSTSSSYEDPVISVQFVKKMLVCSFLLLSYYIILLLVISKSYIGWIENGM